jgi:hypothetical protein
VNFLGKKKSGDLIFRILISYIIFIVLIYVLNQDNSDRLGSFGNVFFAAITALFYLGIGGVSRYGFNITKYFIIGFLIKIVIGFLFWEFYMFPDYFSIPTSQFHFDHSEYLYTNHLMQEFAEYRISNGIFSYQTEAVIAKSGFIHYFMSNIYLSGSFNTLDLAVQNSLFSIFTALIIAHIVKSEGGSSKQIKLALLLGIFQPFSFISTVIWRDVVGQFFIALGGYLLYRATRVNKTLLLILVILASLSMFLQRYIYTFYPIITMGVYYLFQKKNNLSFLLLVPLLGYLVNYFDNSLLLSTHLTESYGDNVSGIKFWLFMPLNIVRLFIGPFPWTNWFNFDDNSIFLIADYFQSVTNITLSILLVKIIFKKKYLLKVNSIFSALSSVDVLFLILFSLFILAGLGTVEIHISYFSSGIIFLIPTISLGYTNKSFKAIFLKVFVFFIALNLLFIVLGFGGQGIGNLLR